MSKVFTPKTLVIKPRISEQTYQLAQEGTYVFEVPAHATKQMISKAVESQYDVTVESVNVAVIKGKMRPSSQRRKPSTYGKVRDVKKAYVRLASGDKITIFEEGL